MPTPDAIFDQPVTPELRDAAEALYRRFHAAMDEVAAAGVEIGQERGVSHLRLLEFCAQMLVDRGVSVVGFLHGVPDAATYDECLHVWCYARNRLREAGRVAGAARETLSKKKKGGD